MFRRFGSAVTSFNVAAVAVSEDPTYPKLGCHFPRRWNRILLQSRSHPVAKAADTSVLHRTLQAETVRTGSHPASLRRVPNVDLLTWQLRCATDSNGSFASCVSKPLPGIYAMGDVKGGPHSHISTMIRILKTNLIDGGHTSILEGSALHGVHRPALGRGV